MRALLGTASHFCKVVVLKLRTTRFEFCFGSAVAVNDNSTLRASASAFLDSFSALACGDGTLRDADDEPTVSSSLLLSSLELSDTQVYEPQIRALLGTASHFCKVVVLKLKR